MQEEYKIHIEFENKEIPDTVLLEVSKLYFKLLEKKFDEAEVKKRIANKFTETREFYDSWRSTWIGVKGVAGFYLVNAQKEYKNEKQQIEIGIEPDISETEFMKYTDFFGKLPPTAKVSAGTAYQFDGDYSMAKIRQVTVFPKQEVEKYGEECLLNFKNAYLIKKLQNGSILIWIGKPMENEIFTDITKAAEKLKKHISKCETNK
ncbi:hypothetical protein GF343_03100 [Candidatus Woesearchaeota archaeon]|nr:hypothetical protein [Candidatus Woesearchaeota archaeon]